MPALIVPTFYRGLCELCPPECFYCDLACYPCHAGRGYSAAVNGEAETMCYPACIAVWCFPGLMFPLNCYMRMKVRERYSITGSLLKDCCVSICLPCSYLQLHRELSLRGVSPGHTCCAPPPPPQIQIKTQQVQPAMQMM